MRFVLINQSTLTDSAFGGAITPDMVKEAADALTTYLVRDLGAYWGGNHVVRAGSSPTDILDGEVVASIVETLPDPGAVAFHSVNGLAAPFILIGHSQCNSIFDGPDSITNATAHELAEAAGDPGCNRWADMGSGKAMAFELADPTQEDGYKIGRVSVSNFVLPAFFAPGEQGPFSFMGTQGADPVTAPFAIAPGGYAIERPFTGDETQVQGMISVRGTLKNLARKRHPVSRTYKRGVRLPATP